MPIALYRILHLIGLFMIYLSLGSQASQSGNPDSRTHFLRKTAAITHGLGMFLSLLGGFGLLAKLGIAWPWPIWVFVMLLSWLLLGAAPAVVKRSPLAAKRTWWFAILLGLISSALAVTKPF